MVAASPTPATKTYRWGPRPATPATKTYRWGPRPDGRVNLIAVVPGYIIPGSAVVAGSACVWLFSKNMQPLPNLPERRPDRASDAGQTLFGGADARATSV